MMPPDLNSLPASSSVRLGNGAARNSEGPGSAIDSSSPPSLQSTLGPTNAVPHRSSSGNSPVVNNDQFSDRRRPSFMNNLIINNQVPSGVNDAQHGDGSNNNSPRLGRRSIIYETADPNHQRQPSLGEIHQELENEQEAQVNRLLHMIRIQQDQIAQIQSQQQPPRDESAIAHDQDRPLSPTIVPNSTSPMNITHIGQSSPHSPLMHHSPSSQGHINRPQSLSRQSSARLSHAGGTSGSASPVQRRASGTLGPLSEDFLLGTTRDESAFYQAETQMLTRENQMLRQRIRELERQISELNTTSQGSTLASIPTTQPSQSGSIPSTFASESLPGITAEVEPTAKLD